MHRHVTSAIVAILALTAGASLAADWPMFRGTPDLKGISQDTLPAARPTMDL
jgi:hypothetical protein